MIALSVAVIDSEDQWRKLAPEWNALLDASASGTIFLTWEWLSAWAECFLHSKRRLFILAFHEKRQLVGIAPFYIEKKKWGPFTLREIRFLGTPEAGSDYLNVFARKRREREVADALYDYLMGEGASAWDQLMLQDLPSDGLLLHHFMNRADAEGKYAEISLSSYCPEASLMNPEDGFPKGISPKRKKRFRQELGILQRETGVEHLEHNGTEPGILDTFLHLYEEKGGWSGKRLRPFMKALTGKYCADSPVQVDLLSARGQAVAGFLHLRYRKNLALYLMAVDKEFNSKISIGDILIGLCIRKAMAAGYQVYDFLKGEEGYKFHWATGGKSGVRIRFWQKHPWPSCSGLGNLARYAGKLILR